MSSEHILPTNNHITAADGAVYDPLDGIPVSPAFDENVFDAAFKSIRYMVWSETWQRYMARKQGPARVAASSGAVGSV